MATTVQRKGTSSTPSAHKTACIVVRYVQAGAELCDLHERVSRTEIARRLATLKGCEFAGDYDPVEHYAGHLYFVPDETLIDVEARRLGIYSEHDLFGGVVPYPFVGTKSVTHPVVDLNASVPAGWRRDLGEQLRNATLFGFTAFNRENARRACMAVLHECGVARVKPSHGIGGRGQVVVSNLADVERAIDSLDSSELSRCGVVIEQNFDDIVTYSVGHVRVGELKATYYGIQSLTKDNNGADAYGGSALVIARGGYDALFKLDISANVGTIISKACAYETAISEAFPEWIASRRNYDVAEATDSAGQKHIGVLEQSWRIGGASPAEIAALEAFHSDSALAAVRASSVQIYGSAAVPATAEVQFRGIDDRLGPITKYTMVQAYDSSE